MDAHAPQAEQWNDLSTTMPERWWQDAGTARGNLLIGSQRPQHSGNCCAGHHRLSRSYSGSGRMPADIRGLSSRRSPIFKLYFVRISSSLGPLPALPLAPDINLSSAVPLLARRHINKYWTFAGFNRRKLENRFSSHPARVTAGFGFPVHCLFFQIEEGSSTGSPVSAARKRSWAGLASRRNCAPVELPESPDLLSLLAQP